MKNQRSDDEQSDDEFLNKLEEQAKGKVDNQIDVDKMTRRQRMAYLANQGETGGHVQAVSGNKSDLYELMGDDNVLLSLGNKTNIQNTGSKPKKPAISQKQADENKRQQLSKILEEQQKKFKEKEKKM